MFRLYKSNSKRDKLVAFFKFSIYKMERGIFSSFFEAKSTHRLDGILGQIDQSIKTD